MARMRSISVWGRFNARMRAELHRSDLPKLMEFLHQRGVRVRHVQHAIFANELAEAEQQLRTMISAGAMRLIVQDVGICRLIRRLSRIFPFMLRLK